MAMQETMLVARASAAPAEIRQDEGRGCLFHPIVDFLCLGGGSLILFALLAVCRPPVSSYPVVAVVMLALANIINHPHFAHSYQIFYRGFREKAFGQHYDPVLRLRYVFAGILVPLALFVYFLGAVLLQDLQGLGFAVNLMLFLVGWHYVKQGYGMLVVCSVLKRQFFSEAEKKVLLINAYAVWLADWMVANWAVRAHDIWGLAYYTFELPEQLVILAMAVGVGSTAAMLWMLARKWWGEGRRLPINGTIAYLTTLYAWLLLNVDPLFLLVIPACHSLQYLVVVWRYQLNADRDRAERAKTAGAPGTERAFGWFATRPALRFSGFLAVGIVLGYLGFWGLPDLLSAAVAVDEAVFGPTLFLFLCWLFINIHHYCLDNVMWRRGNPDTGRYLFAHR
ncbi:hypothetical protein HBA54_20680 [Pelagibius litoralis]|uniref:Uncharacterized protein n=1 Tax=Pelagibius litoralis TaxID=374515 RepID=A0A967F0W6_9PROT|nr:hypothetical protein [Pelagibius litoralis]NIA71019.1 hypothetical protein [Pelagibius litoralis]